MSAEYEAQRKFFKGQQEIPVTFSGWVTVSDGGIPLKVDIGIHIGTPVHVALTTTDETEAIAAPGAGNAIYVLGAIAGNDADTTRTRLILKEGAAGAVRFEQPVAPAGGGFASLLPPGFIWKLAENTALVVQQSAAVNSHVTICHYVAAASA